jgi:hypothetical protein
MTPLSPWENSGKYLKIDHNNAGKVFQNRPQTFSSALGTILGSISKQTTNVSLKPWDNVGKVSQNRPQTFPQPSGNAGTYFYLKIGYNFASTFL